MSPQLLARELGVSVRTLQRAFAGTGEPVTAYTRAFKRHYGCTPTDYARMAS